jgi:hypothetical protein
MKIYILSYDYQDLVTVEIDDIKAAPYIKEMVDFWSGNEHRLDENNGDYTKTWLKQLTYQILFTGRPPAKDDEGWVPLDGSCGIKLIRWERYEFDESMIEVKERN